MQKKKEQSSEELYGELGKVFDFMQGDLEANRAGFISYRQKEAQKKLVYLQAFFIFPTSFIVIALMSLGLSAIFSVREVSSATLCLFVFISLAFFVGLIVFAGMLFYLNNFRRDVNEARLEKVIGQVTQIASSRLRVGDKRLNCTTKQSEYRWGDLVYTVYYLPRIGKILSIEEGNHDAS